jgi:hypothetical protein
MDADLAFAPWTQVLPSENGELRWLALLNYAGG